MHSLEKRCLKCPAEDLEIRTITMDHRSPLSWSDMKLTISCALFSHPFSCDVDTVIDILRAKIETRETGQGDKGKIINTFQNIITPHKSTIPTRCHCQLVLVSHGWERCRNAFESGDPEVQKLRQVSCLTLPAHNSTDMPPGNLSAQESYFDVKPLLSCLLGGHEERLPRSIPSNPRRPFLPFSSMAARTASLEHRPANDYTTSRSFER